MTAINTNQDESKRPAKGSKTEQAEEKGKEQRESETCQIGRQEVGDKMKDRADHPRLAVGKGGGKERDEKTEKEDRH